MANSYSYSAYTYADEWLLSDRESVAMLSHASAEATDDKVACDRLSKVAHFYGISRNFKAEGQGLRLGPAWEALQKIERPLTDEDAKRKVEDLVELLKAPYGKLLWSAASKFLWIRFQSPIVIYDSLSWAWMCRNANCPKNGSWNDFYDLWRKEYRTRRESIREACEGLIAIRKFLPPSSVTDEEFAVAVRSEWFYERVFDHFMLNEESFLP